MVAKISQQRRHMAVIRSIGSLATGARDAVICYYSQITDVIFSQWKLEQFLAVKFKKITAELATNADTIEYKTSSTIHGGLETFELPFTVSGVGLNYHGKMVLVAKNKWLCYIMSMISNLWLEMYP